MGWPQDAYVGQEVVCVDLVDLFNPWHKSAPLIIGGVYKITELNIGAHTNELYFGVNDGTKRLWLARCFRPLATRSTETGMEILRKLQDPANHKYREDA